MPNIGWDNKINPIEFGKWVDDYNKSKVIKENIPKKSIDIIKKSKFILCSTFNRSIYSVKISGKNPDIISKLFREVDIPNIKSYFPYLIPNNWLYIFRIAWIFGYSPNIETVREARSRADACVQQLSELAVKHDEVLFVGHGLLMLLIARRLVRLGWVGPAVPPRGYWAFSSWERVTS